MILGLTSDEHGHKGHCLFGRIMEAGPTLAPMIYAQASVYWIAYFLGENNLDACDHIVKDATIPIREPVRSQPQRVSSHTSPI